VQKTLTGNAGPLSARLDGPEDGVPVLLLHGMAGNSHWWDAVLPKLGGEFRTAALDLRGHGDSGWAEPPRYELPDFAQDVEAARRGLGWERFHLVGHSMGAMASVHYAKDHPDRLLSLTLVDFLGEFNVDASRKFRRPHFRRQPTYASAEDMIPRFRLEPPGTLLDAAGLAALARHCIKPVTGGRWTWKFDWRAFGTSYHPVLPLLSLLRMPGLVVRGGHSTVMPQAGYENVLREFRSAVGREIAAAHHHVPVDTPAELAALMREFLLKACAGAR
jgi:esterase